MTADDLLSQRFDDFNRTLTETRAAGDTWQITITGSPPEQAQTAAAQREAARTFVAVATAAAADARRLQAEAARLEATVPEVARNIRAEAIEKLQRARSSLDRARDVFAPPAPTPAAPPPNRAPLALGSCADLETCRLLSAIQRLEPDGIRGIHDFGGQGILPIAPPPPGPGENRIFRGQFRTDPPTVSADGGTLTTPQGSNLNLGPLRDAVAELNRPAAAEPLIARCNETVCPSRALLQVLNNPQQREELRRIGGVSLAATFDVLALSGISELRGGMNLAYIERPVMVSLSALLAAARSHAGDWNNASDAVRYPGNLGRVHGFVISADESDVFIVGSAAPSPGSRIDIDELSLLLRAIWREGTAPAVSLDPRPDQIGGPQYPRVMNVPADSVVAAIMLDADYAMKAIALRAGWAGPLDLINREAIVWSQSNPLVSETSRFWLSPRPLRPNLLYHSQSGRTLLFETEVQTQTESLFLQAGQLQGAGTTGSRSEAIAQAITRALPAFEADGRVQPAGIFARLHGLMDIAALATALRSLAIDAPVLAGIAALPHRAMTGPEAPRAVYPGLSSRSVRGNMVYNAAGGATLAIRLDSGGGATFADRIGAGLERAADGWDGQLAAPLPQGFALPLGDVSRPHPADEVLLRANALLAQERWDEASAAFRQYIAQEPTIATGYHGLALALLGAGRLGAAAVPVAQAVLFAPEDNENIMLVRDLAWRLDPTGQLLAAAPAVRQALSRHYSDLAGAAMHSENAASAVQFADWAIRLDRNNGEAHQVRAFLYPIDSQGREMELSQAIRANRAIASAGLGERRQLALSLLLAGGHHLMRGTRALLAGNQTGLVLLQTSVSELTEAEALEPGFPEPAALRLRARAVQAKSYHPDDPVLASLEGPARDLRARFPDNATVISTIAMLFALDERYAEAIAISDEGMRLAPNDPLIPDERASYEVELGRCDAAAAHLALARQLAGSRASMLGIDELPACSPRPT